MPESAEERREHARKAAYVRQLKEPSGAAMTAAARAVGNDPARFERAIREQHPDASENDIIRMARAAHEKWKLDFSRTGVRARQAKAAAREAAAAAAAAKAAARRAERAAQDAGCEASS